VLVENMWSRDRERCRVLGKQGSADNYVKRRGKGAYLGKVIPAFSPYMGRYPQL
jgi:hypothetical protein